MMHSAYAIVRKYHKHVSGKVTRYAVLVSGAYVFYGTKKQCEEKTK